MDVGVLAAGHGRRLDAPGSKALVNVAGRPLLMWCIDALGAVHPRRIHVVTNSVAARDVETLLPDDGSAQLHEANTESALESFGVLLAALDPGPFLIGAVDSLLTPLHALTLAQLVRSELPTLAISVAHTGCADMSAVGVHLDSDGRIRRIGGSSGAEFATAGGYGGRDPKALPTPPPAARLWGLRDYLAWLTAEECDVRGAVIGEAFDIDNRWDLQDAEERLSKQSRQAPLSK